MKGEIKAVIFDMDGVLIDSEPLWRKAMIKGFAEFGIPLTEEDCKKTTGRRFSEVADEWINYYQLTHTSSTQIEESVVNYLIQLIETEGKAINGVEQLIEFCVKNHLKVGLATSSSNALMQAVLKKLNLQAYFNTTVSAEHLKYAKPHPEVFLSCAQQLAVNPKNCLVIEDSVNGDIAAKAAQMQLIIVPDQEHQHLKQFSIADHLCKDMHEAKQKITGILKLIS